MRPIVSLEDVSLHYHSKNGETPAVSHVNLEIDQGEFVSIVGPSGCGKSSLLSMLSGLISPSTGNIQIDGEIGYMLQKDHLLEWRTVRDNALLGLDIKGMLTAEHVEYVEYLLEQYGLRGFMEQYPDQLSGGMRQRVALIRTLAIRPDILLLDEPFSALDYQTRLTVSDEIGSIIRKEKKTAILVSHDISEAISLSDRVVVFSARPATVKNIHNIELSLGEYSPMQTRESPMFQEYFNRIWKELDIHADSKKSTISN